jgi:hypothetical protein
MFYPQTSMEITRMLVNFILDKRGIKNKLIKLVQTGDILLNILKILSIFEENNIS